MELFRSGVHRTQRRRGGMRECPLEREMDEGRLDGKAGGQFSGQQVREGEEKRDRSSLRCRPPVSARGDLWDFTSHRRGGDEMKVWT